MPFDVFTVYALSGVGLLVVLAIGYLAYRWPAVAVPVGCVLVLLADTKFRIRDPKAAMSGAADTQTLVELGLYALLAVVAVVLLTRSRRTRLCVTELLVCAYIAVCIASARWSLAPNVTMVRSFQVLVLFAFTYAALRAAGPERMARGLTSICAVYVLVCSALVPVLPELQAYRMEPRFGWFYVHPIVAGTYAALAALFVLSMGLFSPKGWRNRILGCPIWLYPLPLLAILLATGSRGPLLAFTGAALVLVLKRLRPHNAVVVASMGVMAVIVVVGSRPNVESVFETSNDDDNFVVRQLLRGQSASQFIGLSGRVELWENTVGPLLKQPLTGYGYQGSRLIVLNAAEWAGDAHSAYLQTLLDVGFLGGLFIFSAFIAVLLRHLFVRHRPASGWAGAHALGTIVFILLNAITHEGFAIVGLELLVAFTSVGVAASYRVPSAAPARQRHPGVVMAPLVVGRL